MSEDDRDKRKKKPWWEDDSFFNEFGNLDELMKKLAEGLMNFPKMNELIEGIFKDMEQDKDKFMNLREPLFWGFSITRGPDNKPVVRKLGNIEPREEGAVVKEGREPLIDVITEGKETVVIAELPGVEKNQINLKATESYLIISANAPQRRYYKKIDFKEKIDPESSKAVYKNGVLEVRFKNYEGKKNTGTEIKIQ